jgi:hypothetical protein
MADRKRFIGTAALVLAAVAAAGAVALAAGLATSSAPSDVLRRAQDDYVRHNYAQAMAAAEGVIAGALGEDDLHGAQKLKALCMCMLRREDGYAYGKQIMEGHAPFADDPELWSAMGTDRSNVGDAKKAHECFAKAGELFEAAGDDRRAADAWISAAQEVMRAYDILPAQARTDNWQDKRRIAIDRAIEIYEHVVSLPQAGELREAKALLAAGQAARGEGSWEYAQKALELFRRAVEGYPLTGEAATAQMQRAETYEQFGKYVDAVRNYAMLISHFTDPRLAKDAKQRIDQIKSPQLTVSVAQPFTPGARAQLYWSERNVKTVTLEAHRVDLPAALGAITGKDDGGRSLLERIAEHKGEFVRSWTFTTPDEGDYQPHSNLPEQGETRTTIPIDVPFSEAGAYVVEASGVNPDNQRASSLCLVIFSDMAAVAKCDSDQALLYVAQASDGQPVGGADVTVLRYSGDEFPSAAGKTDDAGLAQLRLTSDRNYSFMAAVKSGEQQAVCAGGRYYWYWWGYNQAYKVHGFTDRPVYRPGDVVHFEQVLRRNNEGTYENMPSTTATVEITDPKGQKVYSSRFVTDEFGSFEGSFKTNEDAPLGLYQINVTVQGQNVGFWQTEGNRFRVEEYKKPEFKVAVEPGQADYRVGSDMKIKISARYYFGQPVADAEVSFDIRKRSYWPAWRPPHSWPWYYDMIEGHGGRWWPGPRFDEHVVSGQARTDAEGNAYVTVKAEPFKDHEDLDLEFVVSATVTDASRRVIRGAGEVKVTHAPFFIFPRPAQAVYGPGDSVEIDVKTEDPNSKPVGGKFAVEAWKINRVPVQREKEGRTWTEYEERLEQKVYTGSVDVGADGRGALRFVPDLTGRLKVIVSQPAGKEGETPVTGSCELWVASKTGAEAHYAYNDLQIVPAADQYEIGQTMKLLVNTARADSRVLLTAEADGLLFWRIVHVRANSELVEIPIDKTLTPNFTLTATLIRDNMIYRDSKQIVVPPTNMFIKVDVVPRTGSMGGGEEGGRYKYQPREETKVVVRLTDVQTGKPVVGQVAAMLVDSSVYYIQPEFREAIEKAFYGYVRSNLVATQDSFSGPAALGQRPVPLREQFRFGDGGRGGELMARSGEAGGRMLAMDAAKMAPAPMAAAEESPQDQLAEPVLREDFRDTALWVGSLVTDADGVCELPVALPDQLSTFALHVIAFDKDTRVGESTTDIVTTKRIIVRMEAGRFFTEGDRGYVTVIAHNYYDQPQDLKVDLAVSDELKLERVNVGGEWSEYASGAPIDVTVAAAGEVRLDFLAQAVRPGEAELTAQALGTRESDALKLTLPVIEWGAGKLAAAGGMLRGPGEGAAEWTFTVPGEIKRGSQTLTVTLNPSIAAVAMDALPYLARYPYGCVEQTMSRFLPTVVMRKTLQDAGVSLDEIREHVEGELASDPKLAARYAFIRKQMGRNPVYSEAEADKMVKAGIDRLADMQHSDGGWGWWKGGDSDPYMTAYVTYGLTVARDCDVSLPSGMLDRAGKFLVARASQSKDLARQDWWYRHADNDNTRAYMLFVIGRIDAKLPAGHKLAGELDRVFAARDELTDYGRAYLALALHAAGKDEAATIVVENFQNTVQVNEKTGSAHWGETSGWWYWYQGDTEITAWVLQAMLTIRPSDQHIPGAVSWLVANRRDLAWGNTKATATAVLALARYAKAAGELDCDQTFDVMIDDRARTRVTVTRANLFTFDGRVEVSAADLAPGEHKVSVTRTGSGNLYWGAYCRYYTTAERIAAGGNGLSVARKYFRLVPEEFTNTRTVWKEGHYVKEQFPDTRYKREPLDFAAEIASGQMIDVDLSIDAEENLEYMIFTDPKPAGCEPYRLVSGGSYEGGTYANMELRDEKVVFFANYLGQGSRKLTYRLVCERPGTFRVLPASGEAMYTPFVEAISDSGKLSITVKPE